jgi:hypothetical protein
MMAKQGENAAAAAAGGGFVVGIVNQTNAWHQYVTAGQLLEIPAGEQSQAQLTIYLIWYHHHHQITIYLL